MTLISGILVSDPANRRRHGRPSLPLFEITRGTLPRFSVSIERFTLRDVGSNRNGCPFLQCKPFTISTGGFEPPTFVCSFCLSFDSLMSAARSASEKMHFTGIPANRASLVTVAGTTSFPQRERSSRLRLCRSQNGSMPRSWFGMRALR